MNTDPSPPEPQNEPWLTVEPGYPTSLRISINGRHSEYFSENPPWSWQPPYRFPLRPFLPEMYWSVDGGGSFTQVAWINPLGGTLTHPPFLCAPPGGVGCTVLETGGDTSSDFDSEGYHFMGYLAGYIEPAQFPASICYGPPPCVRTPANTIFVTYRLPTNGTPPTNPWPGNVPNPLLHYSPAAYPPRSFYCASPQLCPPLQPQPPPPPGQDVGLYLYRVDFPTLVAMRGAHPFNNRIAVSFHYLIPSVAVPPDPNDSQSVWVTWSDRSRFPNWYAANPNPLDPPPPGEPNPSAVPPIRSRPGGFRVSDPPMAVGCANAPPPEQEFHHFARIAATWNGTLYTAWTWIGEYDPLMPQELQIGPGQIRIDRSLDGGTTWRNGADVTFGPTNGCCDVVVKDIRAFQALRIRTGGPGLQFMDAPSILTMAPDPFDPDMVHLAWSELTNPGPGIVGNANITYGRVRFLSGCDAQIFTRQVNDDVGVSDQYFPVISVDSNRVVHLIWYDRRDDTANQKFHVYYSRSSDLGQTWSSNQRISLFPSDAEWAPVRTPGYAFFGDYNGAASATLHVDNDVGFSHSYKYASYTANPKILGPGNDDTDIHFVPLHTNGLSVFPSAVQAGMPTTVTFSLAAGSPNNARTFHLLGSSTGTAIGINYDGTSLSCPPPAFPSLLGVVIPLTGGCSMFSDPLFCNTFFWNQPCPGACQTCLPTLTFQNFSGTLNAPAGSAAATITGSFPTPGTFHFAFVIGDVSNPNYASNVVSLTVTP